MQMHLNYLIDFFLDLRNIVYPIEDLISSFISGPLFVWRILPKILLNSRRRFWVHVSALGIINDDKLYDIGYIVILYWLYKYRI